MGLTRTVDPTVEPVSLDEVKDHSRVDGTDSDAVLTILLQAAREYVEHHQKRQLITATYELTLDEFPSGPIILPNPPLISVTSISYEDTAGDTQTWASSNYQVDITELRGSISVEPNVTYPTTETDRKNAVTITFDAGYGTSPSDVPETTRLAIMMLAAHWHENREPVVVGMSVATLPMHVQGLIAAEAIKAF
ncbi:MAG: phage head-tail connector protein [Chloroflexi bacterium]|nr:phage head-tail connector protein [Chloroflexota bacterium]